MRANKFICAANKMFLCLRGTCGAAPPAQLLPLIHSRRSTILPPLLCKMYSPPSEDPLAAFDFLSDFLPAVDFGEGFRFDQPFDFADFGEVSGGPPSYGGYDDDSCSFSVEGSVVCRCRGRKQRNPNRHGALP